MAYQPTYPSPYMEAIDATQEGGNIFKCLINPKDTILDASINIYNNGISDEKLVYTGGTNTVSGDLPQSLTSITFNDVKLYCELEKRIRQKESLLIHIVYNGVTHKFKITSIQYFTYGFVIYFNGSVAIDNTSYKTYAWQIYTQTVNSITLPESMFPFTGGLSDESWLSCVVENNMFNNGEDYKWSISLKTDEYKPIVTAHRALVPQTISGGSNIDCMNNVYCAMTTALQAACMYAINQDGCHIVINSETRQIDSINTVSSAVVDGVTYSGVSVIKLKTPLSKAYTNNNIYTIMQSFDEFTSPEYYFKARTNPVVVFDVPEVINSSSHTFSATYSQDQKVGVAYFQYNLLKNGIEIASSGKVFTQNISHTFENLVSGTEYIIKLTIVNNDGVEIYEERTFSVDYPIMATTINPIISVDNDKTCISVDFSNNASIPSTLIGADCADYEVFGKPDYIVVSSGNVIAYSSPSITIEPYDNIMSNMYIKIGEETIKIVNYIRQEDETIVATLEDGFDVDPLIGSSYEICSYYNGIHLDEEQAILWDNVNDKPLVIPDRSSQVLHWHGSHGFNGLILEKINSEFVLGSTNVSYDGENFTYKLGTSEAVSYCPYSGTATAIAGRDEHSVVGTIQAYDSSFSSVTLESSEFITVGRSVQIGNEYRTIIDIVVNGETVVATLDRAFDIEPTTDDTYAVYDDNYLYVLSDNDELSDTDILIDNDLSYKYWWLIVLLPDSVRFIKTVPFTESEV